MRRNKLLTILGALLVVLALLSAIATLRGSAQVPSTKTIVIPDVVETNGTVEIQKLVGTSVIPRLQDLSGRNAQAEFNVDTEIFATYAGLSDRSQDRQPINIRLYIFDQLSGEPLRSAKGNEVCNPCSFALIPRPGSLRRIIVHDLIESSGGFNKEVVTAVAVMVITGSEAENVSCLFFVTNAYTSPFKLSVFSFSPEPVSAATP